MSPALVGGFFTIEPPGKPNHYDSLKTNDCVELQTSVNNDIF